MPLEAKKKLVGFCAGMFTFIIFGAWLVHATGIFSSAYESASAQGVALFSFVEQNVGQAYDAFQKNVPSMTASSTGATTENIDNTEASSTANESNSISTTTAN